ncbi:MAG: succinyl-CoA synthetase alpha subunit [Chloroflexota bacterium]|jgi:succinyl-CoA synthetase alpha subunit|nr:succinyl-CoA synthetase alpha subunit [Chloroflexota bacterium]
MAILVDSHTRVVVTGATGQEGARHTGYMREYGTNVVAGVTPGRGGQDLDGLPILDTVHEAVQQHGANTAIIFVPPPFAGDSICECVDAGSELVICITEGLPTLDAIRAVRFAGERGVRVIGPNCPGVMTPGQSKVGIMPADIFREGCVGVVSRSGTLTYEVVNLLTENGLGVSTCVGIGGDPVIGTTFTDVLELFRDDPDTCAVILIGEIGGADEEMAAELIGSGYPKPVVSFISGRSAPPGKRMGHAGAIISGNTGTPQGKVDAFKAVGVQVGDTLDEVVHIVQGLVKA